MQQIGETREAMRSVTLSQTLYRVAKEANKEKGLNNFWITISHKPDKLLWNVIREGIVVTSRKPPKLIGAMCWHVIWDRGLIEPEWILPMDLGVDTTGCFGNEGNSSLITRDCADIPTLLR